MDEERNSGGRWRRLAGGCVIALFAAAGCSLSSAAISELQPGECFTGEFIVAPMIEVIECEEADPMDDYVVVFAERATGKWYPGNRDEMYARCESEGGRLDWRWDEEAWDDGERTGLCYTSALAAEFFE